METRQPSSPIRAAIYARISRDREGAGLGVERQEADCRALAERLGWTVVAVYVDNDVSAYSGKPRPQYRAMLDAVRAGQVQGVVAWHTDRLHRRATELEEFVSVAEAHHLQVQTVTAGTVDLSTASGRMIARMLGAAAQHEIDHAKERMKRAKAQLAADGRYRGGQRPFGFDADGVTVRDDEAQAIRDAATAILAGRPLRALSREWNEAGLRTSTGREWSHVQLRELLLRPRNAGLIHSGRVAGSAPMTIIGKAQWPAIIDEETWSALVALLTEPSRRNNASNDPNWLGSGIYSCGLCGGTMRVTSIGATPARGGTRRHHYRCIEKPHLTIAVKATDDHVKGVVAELVRDPRIVAAMTPTTDDGALTVDRERRAVLSASLAQTEADYDADLIDARRYKAKVEKLSAETAEIDARLADAVRQSTASPILSAVDPGAAFLAAPLDVQRAVLRAVLRVEVMPAGQRGAKWSPQRLHLSPVA